MYPATEGVCLKECALGTQSLKSPFFNGAQGDKLQVWRAHAHAFCPPYRIFRQVRIREALGHQLRFNSGPAINHFPCKRPTGINARSLQRAAVRLVEGAKLSPRHGSPLLRIRSNKGGISRFAPGILR